MSHEAHPLLLETIKIEAGHIKNLAYHQKRCDQSRHSLFNVQNSINLSTSIHPPQEGVYRCRILYTQKIHSIEYLPYLYKEIKRLKIVPSDIDYAHKYANREALNHLRISNPNVDEVIIEKGGYLTDTTISNIAFYDGKRWITPKTPLLQGTMRSKLIDEGYLRLEDISKVNLHTYTHVALMNAMIGFKVINIDPVQIR
ncbi:MAG: aminotransferase class IV [Campylobacterota bacterium]|nr:aminotransferase class IV [Campylobacterota bacterium]